MADWASLFSGDVTDPRPLITETAAVIDRVLRSRPQADQEVLTIIAKRLGNEIGEKTWEDIENVLGFYLGPDAPALVLWVASDDLADRIAKVEEVAPERVAALVRAIVGLYGPELKLSHQRWNELPNDWFGINREIYYDVVRDRVVIKIRIDKNSGEQVFFEGLATSILELTANILRTCRMVDRPGAFSQPVVELLSQEYEEFLKISRLSEGESVESTAGEVTAPRSGEQAAGKP